MRNITFSVSILSFLFFILEAEAMSLFDIGKTCVFSEVQLQVIRDGKPLTGVTVTRQWDWNKRRSDEGITNDQGMVSFPAVFESSVSRLLPTELVIGQQISVNINDEESVVWTNGKREPEENSEYGGKAFDVICDVNNEEELIEDYGSLMVTKWKLK